MWSVIAALKWGSKRSCFQHATFQTLTETILGIRLFGQPAQCAPTTLCIITVIVIDIVWTLDITHLNEFPCFDLRRLAAIYAVWAAIYALSFRTRQGAPESHFRSKYFSLCSQTCCCFGHFTNLASKVHVLLISCEMFVWRAKGKVHNYKKWVTHAELLEQLKCHVLDPLQCGKEIRLFDASTRPRSFQKHLWNTHFGKKRRMQQKTPPAHKKVGFWLNWFVLRPEKMQV